MPIKKKTDSAKDIVLSIQVIQKELDEIAKFTTTDQIGLYAESLEARQNNANSLNKKIEAAKGVFGIKRLVSQKAQDAYLNLLKEAQEKGLQDIQIKALRNKLEQRESEILRLRSEKQLRRGPVLPKPKTFSSVLPRGVKPDEQHPQRSVNVVVNPTKTRSTPPLSTQQTLMQSLIGANRASEIFLKTMDHEAKRNLTWLIRNNMRQVTHIGISTGMPKPSAKLLGTGIEHGDCVLIVEKQNDNNRNTSTVNVYKVGHQQAQEMGIKLFAIQHKTPSPQEIVSDKPVVFESTKKGRSKQS